jgi:Na+/melibiose symporter-like transporter
MMISIYKLVFIFSTPVFFAAAAMVAYNYPITHERHRVLREELERRAAAQGLRPSI